MRNYHSFTVLCSIILLTILMASCGLNNPAGQTNDSTSVTVIVQTIAPTSVPTRVPTWSPYPNRPSRPTAQLVPSPTTGNTSNAIPTKAIDTCSAQVVAFKDSVSKMIYVAHSLLNNMGQYADYGLKSSFSQSFVERTFAGLNGIPVPECADQPTEIVYNLGLIRDTMLPAYIEMAVGGGTDPSRGDVARWRDEVDGLLNEVDRLMAEIE